MLVALVLVWYTFPVYKKYNPNHAQYYLQELATATFWNRISYIIDGREVPLRLSFYPNGSGIPIPVSTLVKDLGVQTDNMFSPSAQCTEAANKGRRLILMIRHSFQDLKKLAFIPLYGALVRPHLEYVMSACSPSLAADINHLVRIQILATRLVTGMRHLPYEERLQPPGLHSLQRRRFRDDLITAFKIFKGLLDIDQNLFFLPPAGRGLRGDPFNVLQGASHCRRVDIFGEGCEILE